ncbi:NUDIX hydrolase [Halolactibacillus alkaliphilus]|uniref:8-oxo-dGTP diphosphatase n=1 Tax=Halolactibacillus alkaliphilus TaxID=442899 RepID=A0A511X2F7_9BACI|nr:(deoxy)nucleoside triphosphate pyrophosphohydrolase [Halolactibacillus alkaliphilus]GEN57132.1 NUDIX hydrolase [Halolactibacillus alkaliphilus]GGN72109.1 NUDIX hydrolase [Halolactibacillus alkaliphilus]SFO88025.1 8-oxo-dGTP diphosphatase [Halolactibacillus alkaliphilus]
MKKNIRVVAAIIENDHNEIFCALRSSTMSLPNLWEFPGGKIEAGERVHEALRREISEEFDCHIQTSQDIFMETSHDYDTFTIELIAIKATLLSQTVKLTEHAQYIWLKRDNLLSLNWAPADLPIVEKLIQEQNP